MKDNRLKEMATEFGDNQSHNTDVLESEEYENPEDVLRTGTTLKLILLMIAITFAGVLFANKCKYWAYYYEIITTTLFGFVSVYACVSAKRQYPWRGIMMLFALALLFIYLLPWILALFLTIFGVNYNFIV